MAIQFKISLTINEQFIFHLSFFDWNYQQRTSPKMSQERYFVLFSPYYRHLRFFLCHIYVRKSHYLIGRKDVGEIAQQEEELLKSGHFHRENIPSQKIIIVKLWCYVTFIQRSVFSKYFLVLYLMCQGFDILLNDQASGVSMANDR